MGGRSAGAALAGRRGEPAREERSVSPGRDTSRGAGQSRSPVLARPPAGPGRRGPEGGERRRAAAGPCARLETWEAQRRVASRSYSPRSRVKTFLFLRSEKGGHFSPGGAALVRPRPTLRAPPPPAAPPPRGLGRERAGGGARAAPRPWQGGGRPSCRGLSGPRRAGRGSSCPAAAGLGRGARRRWAREGWMDGSRGQRGVRLGWGRPAARAPGSRGPAGVAQGTVSGRGGALSWPLGRAEPRPGPAAPGLCDFTPSVRLSRPAFLKPSVKRRRQFLWGQFREGKPRQRRQALSGAWHRERRLRWDRQVFGRRPWDPWACGLRAGSRVCVYWEGRPKSVFQRSLLAALPSQHCVSISLSVGLLGRGWGHHGLPSPGQVLWARQPPAASPSR